MSYYRKVLVPDEKILYLGRIHWSVYLRAWFYLIIAAAAGVTYLLHPLADPTLQMGIGILAAIFLLLALFAWLGAWIRRRSTEIVVTDRRIIFKEGLIRRRTMEMNTNKVETVDVLQSLGGRLLNFGTVVIRGTGSSYEPLRGVADPLALRTAIVAQ